MNFKKYLVAASVSGLMAAGVLFSTGAVAGATGTPGTAVVRTQAHIEMAGVQDPDDNAPCAIDAATGEETGNCENSQNAAGPEDNGQLES